MVPLQADIGLGILAAALVINLLITGAITYWVNRDAKRRGSDSVTLWTVLVALSCFFNLIPLGVVVVILYFVVGRPDDTTSQYGDVDEEWN